MTLTLTDLFCGAGGSSSGAVAAGVVLRLAANHWRLAVETHAKNFTAADHDVADISQTDPRRYPATDVLWASPECTNHSIARGRRRDVGQPDLFGQVLPDEAAERSRATMWDVARFVEAKLLAGRPYRGFVVENVLDVVDWLYYRAWWRALSDAGYCLHEVHLNSMHAGQAGDPAPQSRDRWYCVGHLATTRCPDLDRWTRPTGWCPSCQQDVRVVQAWKRPGRPGGRYRAQYVYRCPHTSCRGQIVEPAWIPASAVLDWSVTGKRIGDRARPLAAKTIARIEHGLHRYGQGLLVPVDWREGKTAAPVHRPHRTQTARTETALLVPCGGTWRWQASPSAVPFPTRTTTETDGVVQWRAVYGYDTGRLRSPDEPLPTQTTVLGDAVVAGVAGTAVPVPDVRACTFRMLTVPEIQAAMAFDPGYQLLGNRRERIHQLGNAVTPPAARDLLTALTEVIT